VRTLLLFWVGQGAIGTGCLARIVWQIDGEYKPVNGRLGMIVGGSVFGPLALLPCLIYILDPVTFVLQWRAQPKPRLARPQRIASYALAPLVVVVLTYVLIIQPMQTRSW
jgi:hypothetical protein